MTPPLHALVVDARGLRTPSPNAISRPETYAKNMYPSLHQYLTSLVPELQRVPAARLPLLDRLVRFVEQAGAEKRPARLHFICTHNSRRSHLGQLWAAAAAAYCGVLDVETFSGGTEVTAFHPNAVAAIERAGFSVEAPSGSNPRYIVRWDAHGPAQVCFSKVYDDPANPTTHFAAVMTCTDADEKCPVVLGASLRLSLPYEDPKAADNSPAEASTYDERSRQIATEMLYVFSRVAQGA